MAPHLADSGSARTRFQREARAAAAITHDNVIDTYGVSEANGLPYLVMPFARGPSLQKRIDESGPLTAVEVVRIGRQIAAGLAAAHEQGLVHRDIKPANILLNEGIERLWITDFGVARAMDDASMTQTGVIAGTPQYMSPEQARGENVDHCSDLFSMGSVLYTACTGRPPFRSEAAYGILRRITDTEPRAIRELNPDIPEWLCRVISRLMAKDANLRFESATEVAELFEGCLAHMQQPTIVELPQTVRTDVEPRATLVAEKLKPKSGQSKRKGLLALVGAVMLGALGLFAWQQTEPVDVSGTWAGERWKSVSLTTVENATGWYSGSFTDDQGRGGAIQLQWSRLHRQYSGQWKVGDAQGGEITVRSVGSELRGVITVDVESETSSDIPPLRDYAWKRSNGGNAVTSVPTAPREGRSLAIEAKTNGRIVRWGEGIVENASVKKGDLICEIQSIDATSQQHLQSQIDATGELKRQAALSIKSLKNNLYAKQEVLEAYESRYATFQNVADNLKKLELEETRAAKAKVEASKQAVPGAEAELAEAKANLDRQTALHNENVVPLAKLQEAKKKHAAAEARVREKKNAISANEIKVSQVRQEYVDKKSKAQLDIDKAKIELTNARVEVEQVQGELTAAEDLLARLEKSVAEMRAELEKLSVSPTVVAPVQVVAPISGSLRGLTTKTTVKEGDRICTIVFASDTDSGGSRKPKRGTRDYYRNADHKTSQSRPDLPDSVEAALTLGQRFRGLQRLDTDAALSLEEKQWLGHASKVRDTSIAILKVQLNAGKEIAANRTAIVESLSRAVEAGDAPVFDLLQPRISLAEANGNVAELELLLAYYEKLGTTMVDPALDAQLANDVLKAMIESLSERAKLQTELAKIQRQRFELGDVESGIVTAAQDLATVADSELQAVKVLLSFYSNGLQKAAIDSDADPAIGTGLQRLANREQQEATLEFLKARQQSANARLKSARQELEAAKESVASGNAPATSFESVRIKVAEQEALLETLKLQVDHYRSQDLSP